MPRLPGLLLIFTLLASLLWLGLPTSQTAELPATGLAGRVTADGKPLEGIAISARAQNKTFTTSVYTNEHGDYFFPPLENGQYRIWAQAVGFETARAEQILSSGNKVGQNFTLKPTQDVQKQLSDAEWFESLPDDTAEDRRMKKVILNICGTCHESGFVLEKRFDAAGWEVIVNYMLEQVKDVTDIPGGKTAELDENGDPIGPPRMLMEYYKKDIVAYLSRVRGPQSLAKPKPFPRPTGDATAVVITEYDIPRSDDADRYGNYEYRNGSDWSRGIRSPEQESVTHDAGLSTDGNVYFTSSPTPGRTVGKLDPRTGIVTSFQTPGRGKEEGLAAGSQFGNVDRNGIVWLMSTTSRMIVRFDPKTQQFQQFPYPKSIKALFAGGALDSQGNLWVSQHGGAVRLNPQTGEFKEFKSVTKVGRPYDLVLDSADNAWFTLMAVDRIDFVDARSGEVSELNLPPLEEELTAKDREIGERSGAWTNGAPLFQKGPRRLGADPSGNTVWIGEFWAGRIAKIDIHAKKITEYKLPYRYSYPYKFAVDKNHMVWFGMANADRLGKFNPFTEHFTMYQLPTRGTDSRCITIDNSTDLPTIWVPYTGANKIARVQLRDPVAQQMGGRRN